MLGGSATPDDVIRQAGNGIYVEDVSNGQVKIGEGDFAFYVSQGRMIENGKLTSPIKDVNIMGNGPKMLANITMAANDLEDVLRRSRTMRQIRTGYASIIRIANMFSKINDGWWYPAERRPVMNYKKDQQQEFRELAGWVIDQTRQSGANDCKVSISKRRFVEINYRNRKPEVIKEATTQGLYLEVFVDKKVCGKIHS